MFWRNNLILLSLYLFAGCSDKTETCPSPETNETNECIHSSLLQIEELKDHNGFAVTISNVNKSENNQIFILSSDKQSYESCSNFIQIPVEKAVIFSATHLFMMDTLGALNATVGFSNQNYTAKAGIQSKIENGEIKELGDFANADIESIVMMEPGLVMISGFGDNSVKIEQLRKAGIPVIVNYEWQENTPLGRAEWIKLFGALFNKIDLSNKIFSGIEKSYLTVKVMAKKEPFFEDGFLYGIPFKGLWDVPGGNSFMSKIFEDANMSYPWQDNTQTGSLSLDFESIAYKQKSAKLWLSCGHNSKLSLINSDPRFKDFEAYQTGSIYNYHKKIGKNGVLRYWEESVLRCDKILSDLVEICHFGARPEHLYFLKKLK